MFDMSAQALKEFDEVRDKVLMQGQSDIVLACMVACHLIELWDKCDNTCAEILKRADIAEKQGNCGEWHPYFRQKIDQYRAK